MDPNQLRELLSDTSWLRRLARSMMRDPELAEDVVQETLALAMNRREAVGRPWLSSALRNTALTLLRRESIRHRRESTATPRDSEPDTAELVAQAELQQLAVQALLDLEEPYRTTLLMRFMRGLSPRSTARRMGVPLETVRTRQRRGLALLRIKLDEGSGRGSSAVMACLLHEWPGPSTLYLWGFLLMKTKIGVAAGAALLLCLAIGLAVGTGAPDPDPVQAEASLSDLQAEPNAVRDLDPAQPRTPLEEPAGAAADSSSAAEVGSLLVRIVQEETREPVARVGIRLTRHPFRTASLFGAERLPQLLVTDASGEALFTDLPPGGYDTRLDGRSGYADFEIAPGKRHELLLEIPPGLRVTGRVLDPQGMPVPGAEVLICTVGMSPQWTQVLCQADDRGEFLLEEVGAMSCIGARTDLHGPSDLVFLSQVPGKERGEVQLEIRLPGRAVSLAGSILDAAGNGVPHAWVQIGEAYISPDWEEGSTQEARDRGEASVVQKPSAQNLSSDPRGEFVANGLRAGSTKVRVTARGQGMWHGDIDLVAGEENRITIQLEPESILEGHVFDADGQPVPGISVAQTLPRNSSVIRTTDDDGHFELPGLPSGRREFRVSHSLKGRASAVVVLLPGQRSFLDLHLVPDRMIRGQLVDQRGDALSGWQIYLRYDNSTDGSGAGTDEEGRFTFSIKEEAFSLNIQRHMGFDPVIRRLSSQDLPRDEFTIRIPDAQMPSALIKVRAVNAQGEPLARVSFDVYQLPRDNHVWVMDWGEDGSVSSRTFPKGEYDTGLLPPGEYRIEISLPGYETVRLDGLRLAAGQVLDLGDVTLHKR